MAIIKATEEEQLEHISKIISYYPAMKQVYDFSVKVDKPLTWWQLNMLMDHNSRSMGKTFVAIMEILSYVASKSKSIHVPSALVTHSGSETIKAGRHNWDDLSDAAKAHFKEPQTFYVDVYMSGGSITESTQEYFRQVQDIIKGELNGLPVHYKQVKKEIHFECNNYVLRILSIPFRRAQEMSNDIIDRLVSQHRRGFPQSEFHVTDLNIQL